MHNKLLVVGREYGVPPLHEQDVYLLLHLPPVNLSHSCHLIDSLPTTSLHLVPADNLPNSVFLLHHVPGPALPVLQPPVHHLILLLIRVRSRTCS